MVNSMKYSPRFLILLLTSLLIIPFTLIPALCAEWQGELNDGTKISKKDFLNLLEKYKKRAESAAIGTNEKYPNFSGANLRGADLRGVDLSGSIFNKTDLSGANLNGANLRSSNFHEANLSKVDLTNSDLKSATFYKADLRGANLEGADFKREGTTSKTDFSESNLSGLKLSGMDLSDVNFNRADLSDSDLSGANLYGAELYMANLTRSNFNSANLESAHLENADLSGAALTKADLKFSSLSGADLSRSDLTGATLSYTQLNGTKAVNTKFFNVIFESNEIEGLIILGAKGLSTLQFTNYESVVKLREITKQSSFRNEERDLTAALRKYRFKDIPWYNLNKLFENILLDLPTDYGANPWRCIEIFLVSLCIFCIPYYFRLRQQGIYGIWKIWPSSTYIKIDTVEKKPERLKLSGFKAIGTAIQFSILSACSIGWRDFNFGNWIARLQRHEYTFRANGWTRTISGFQSLLSVYLLALWALTFFARPFD
jgi:uncharacterized protein YjbI with pentapeptide repeats